MLPQIVNRLGWIRQQRKFRSSAELALKTQWERVIIDRLESQSQINISTLLLVIQLCGELRANVGQLIIHPSGANSCINAIPLMRQSKGYTEARFFARHMGISPTCLAELEDNSITTLGFFGLLTCICVSLNVTQQDILTWDNNLDLTRLNLPVPSFSAWWCS